MEMGQEIGFHLWIYTVIFVRYDIGLIHSLRKDWGRVVSITHRWVNKIEAIHNKRCPLDVLDRTYLCAHCDGLLH